MILLRTAERGVSDLEMLRALLKISVPGTGLKMTAIQPMRRLVRSKTTGMFLKLDGTWTTRVEEALNFPSIPDAIRACQTYRLHNTELVYKFDHEELDVAVPICESRAT